MQLKIQKEVEIELNVGVGDIQLALRDSLEDLEATINDPALVDSAKGLAVQRFASDAYQCLRAVSDEMIALTTDEQRQTVVDALLLAVDRWRPKMSIQ